MTRKISLITVVAIAALTVAVPTAFGEGRLAGSQEPGRVPAVNTYRDAFERGGVKPSGTESALSGYLDANERGAVTPIGSTVSGYLDANERGVVSTEHFGSKLATYREAGERAVVPAGPVVVSPISSGSEFEWPQIGVGFGIGIVLVLGLILGLKATRNPPLAH